MSEIKTKATKIRAEALLDKISPEAKRKDGLMLLAMFKKVTGEEPVVWGANIIGFGQYHYKSERSTQEGDWPLVAFAVRKQNLTLYLMSIKAYEELLAKLGKHKVSVGCLYINKLADTDQKVLQILIKKAFVNNKKTLGK
jgi:hypothetical protein